MLRNESATDGRRRVRLLLRRRRTAASLRLGAALWLAGLWLATLWLPALWLAPLGLERTRNQRGRGENRDRFPFHMNASWRACA
jgi:hypothetical protein